MRLLLILLTLSMPFYSVAASSEYNAELAEQLGADDYGMKKYVLVTLLTGENDAKIVDEDERKALFTGHFDNMSKLAESGHLVLAGPLMNAPPKRGIFIFNVATVEEAKALVNSDPAVAAGIFAYDMVEYYGSAALMKINDIHQTLQKNAIN